MAVTTKTHDYNNNNFIINIIIIIVVIFVVGNLIRVSYQLITNQSQPGCSCSKLQEACVVTK